MLRLISVLLTITAVLPPSATRAQGIQRIAAIVNDDVISVFDLRSRIDLIVVSTRLPDTTETRQRIAPQVLRALVDERLQLQEAKQRNITVTDQEIERAVENIEQQNKIPKGQLDEVLKRQGVSSHTVRDQIRASVAWQKLLRRRLQPRVTIGEDEIDEALARIKARQGQTEYHVAEILLSVDSPDDEPEVAKSAERLVDQIRGGATFGALARQFSRSSSAPAGGDLGWIHADEIGKPLDDIVTNMAAGAVSDPVRTLSGFRIVQLLEKRKNTGVDPRDIKVTLSQILLPLPESAPEDEAENQKRLADTLRQTAEGCKDFEALAKEIKSPIPTTLGTFPLTDLSATIRTAVSDLDVGKVSTPVTLPNGLLMLMVCQRDEPKVELPGREQISRQLMEDRLNLMARRYMRDVRLAAVVDIRI